MFSAVEGHRRLQQTFHFPSHLTAFITELTVKNYFRLLSLFVAQLCRPSFFTLQSFGSSVRRLSLLLTLSLFNCWPVGSAAFST